MAYARRSDDKVSQFYLKFLVTYHDTTRTFQNEPVMLLIIVLMQRNIGWPHKPLHDSCNTYSRGQRIRDIPCGRASF
jgi:hypothetical protein